MDKNKEAKAPKPADRIPQPEHPEQYHLHIEDYLSVNANSGGEKK